jgi:hypothetical protein
MHDFFGDLLNGVLSTRIFRNSWVQHVEATCFHMVRFMSPIFPSPKELMGHDQKQRRIEQCSKPLAGLIISSGIILPFYIYLYILGIITIQERGIPFLTNHWLQNIYLAATLQKGLPRVSQP